MCPVAVGRWEQIPRRNLRLSGECGFQLFQVDLFLEHRRLEHGGFDLEVARRQVQGLREACRGGR